MDLAELAVAGDVNLAHAWGVLGGHAAELGAARTAAAYTSGEESPSAAGEPE